MISSATFYQPLAGATATAKAKTTVMAKAIAAACVLCWSQASSAVEVAPYFHSWSGSLMDAKQAAGMNSGILAFAITRGNCKLEQGLYDKLPEAKRFVAAGGRLMLSFGGSDGVYAEVACKDDNQLFNLMEKLMLESGIRRFDFDIEGHQLHNSEASARRARVLARLQAKYPDLYVAISLPGWLHGFGTDSMKLLNTTVAAGVRIDMVIVMAQSFGADNIRTMVVPATVGQATIMTYQAAANQVAGIFRNKTPWQINAMMGITPMIGKNDDGTVFTFADAQTVANYAKSNGVGLISYWSFQRDRAQAYAGSNDLRSYSGVAQANYQYHNIFKSASGHAPPPPAASPAPPTANPGQGTSCLFSKWVEGKWYSVGNVVTYSNGKHYQTQVANPGYNPTVSTYFWNPFYCAGTPGSNPPPAQPACGNQPAWVEGRYYPAGTVITRWNKAYKAKFANPGYDPTISTYYWSRHYC